MARMPVPTRESVPEQYRSVFDEIVEARGGPPETGPGTVTLNSPEAAKHCNNLSDYLRNGSGLPAKLQELAMLTVARSWTVSTSGTPTPLRAGGKALATPWSMPCGTRRTFPACRPTRPRW